MNQDLISSEELGKTALAIYRTLFHFWQIGHKKFPSFESFLDACLWQEEVVATLFGLSVKELETMLGLVGMLNLSQIRQASVPLSGRPVQLAA